MKIGIVRGLVALTALALAACSESTSGPDATAEDLLTLDVAMVAADGALDDVAVMGAHVGGAHGFGEIDRSHSVTFYDGDGAEQDGYDPLTTATIQVVSEMSGEFSRDSWEASVSRVRQMSISGLEGEETTRIVNGSGSEEITRSRHSDEDGTRTYEMSGTLSIEDVVHGVPRSEFPYPLSGTITREVTVTITNGPNGDETRSVTVVIVFDGSQFATMTVNGETFEVDLSAPKGRRPHHRRRGPAG